MIKITKPYIEIVNDKSKIFCNIYINDKHHLIWFEVEKKYNQYLCTERADAYVIGLLNYAMRNKHDIYCEVPVSEELLYSIETDLIPSLVKHGKAMNEIKILAEVAPTLQSGNAVGTGISCGIDSFSAIFNHINTKYQEHDLTHVCINNVGAFNECYDDYGSDKVKDERYDVAEKVAIELGLELVKTDSNFAREIYQNHLLTHTYSSVFAIYMLQKLWKIYYYGSSGYDYSIFTLKDNDVLSADHYELLSLQCFSTSALRIYSEGGASTRLEKTQKIIDKPLVHKYLHVCTTKPYNCGICGKCRRTLVTLDLYDVLESYRAVFDIDYYYKHKKEYYSWLCFTHFNHDAMNEPVYQSFLQRENFRFFAYGQYIKNMFLAPFRFCLRGIRFIGKKFQTAIM